jgi:tol-pal system protein YbgF
MIRTINSLKLAVGHIGSLLQSATTIFLITAALFSIASCCAFAEVQVVDYSIGSKGMAVKESEPVFVPTPAATSSARGLGVEQRIGKLENQVDNINQQNLISKIDELQTRVQKLTGQLEDQVHQIEQLNSQVRSFYQDLNQRLEKNSSEKPMVEKSVADKPMIEKPVAEKPKTINEPIIGEVVEAMPNNAPEVIVAPVQNKETPLQPKTDKDFLKEQQMYQTAIDLLPGKHYETSSQKLRGYLKTYPKGTYVANAYYWLGEISFLKKNYDAAEEAFKVVIDKHAKSKRISDAMFKLALVHQYQGREAQAKQELKKVMQRYPGTSAASLAKVQLEGN